MSKKAVKPVTDEDISYLEKKYSSYNDKSDDKKKVKNAKGATQNVLRQCLAEEVGFEPTRRVNGLRDFEPSPVYPSSSLLVTVYSKIRAKSPHFVPFIWKNVRKMIEN